MNALHPRNLCLSGRFTYTREILVSKKKFLTLSKFVSHHRQLFYVDEFRVSKTWNTCIYEIRISKAWACLHPRISCLLGSNTYIHKIRVSKTWIPYVHEFRVSKTEFLLLTKFVSHRHKLFCFVGFRVSKTSNAYVHEIRVSKAWDWWHPRFPCLCGRITYIHQICVSKSELLTSTKFVSVRRNFLRPPNSSPNVVNFFI